MAAPSYDAFAAVYDQWSAHLTEDVGWYTELVRAADGPMVELAVGTGRLDGDASTSLWWVTRSEWEGLIDAAGLEVESPHGGFAGEPFDEGSKEFVWVVRKPV